MEALIWAIILSPLYWFDWEKGYFGHKLYAIISNDTLRIVVTQIPNSFSLLFIDSAGDRLA